MTIKNMLAYDNVCKLILLKVEVLNILTLASHTANPYTI